MMSQLHICYGPVCEMQHHLPSFLDPLEFVIVYLETWVTKGLFDLRPELLLYFLNMHVLITSDGDLSETVLYIYGSKGIRIFAMFVIVSLACNLRTKRNRARAWARGLQSPVWWNRRYFI
uniref:OM2 protein n=1 Tax=Mus sp. TaxID=10095 RepID=P70654_9MURI|nr:cytoplasmically polyadenylated oocyte-specific maternal transcript [Mus sp.]